MRMSYSNILSNQSSIPELFLDNCWNDVSIDEKKEIIYSIFHVKNWRKLEPQYRIYILQELENINASMQGRKPCKLVLKDDMTNSVRTGPDGSQEIHISGEYVLSGIRYYMTILEDGTDITEKKQLDNENVELFCSLCHEGEHKKQEEGVKGHINTKEINECRLNLLTNPDNKEDNNIVTPSESPIFYKLQPVEYYAFLNSENMTIDTFSMLQTRFGIDEGFNKWLQHSKENSFEALAKKWNKDNDMKRWEGVEYTVVGLRKKVINVMLDNIQSWYNIDGCFKACDWLNLDYHDYSPKMKDDWILDSETIDELGEITFADIGKETRQAYIQHVDEADLAIEALEYGVKRQQEQSKEGEVQGEN